MRTVSVSVSASYCIPQCVRLIAGVCTHYVVYNISKKKNTVDKSKIKDKRKVKPKDKSWVKIGWRTKNRKGWCVQKRYHGIGLPSGSAALNASNVELVTTLLVRAFQATIVWGKKEHLK